MVMGVSPVLAANTDISKEETVYVNAAADGTPQEITVSDWLKNSASAGDLSDVSDLKDIKNVKGDETFSQDGDKLTGIQKTKIFIIRELQPRIFQFPWKLNII